MIKSCWEENFNLLNGDEPGWLMTDSWNGCVGGAAGEVLADIALGAVWNGGYKVWLSTSFCSPCNKCSWAKISSSFASQVCNLEVNSEYSCQ